MPTTGPSSDDASDEDLMLAYAGGSASSFDRLYVRHKGPVYRYLLRQCSQAATADELFQDVWTSVIRARRSYAPTAKFATWLYTLARHRLIDHWRAAGQAGFVSIDDDDTAMRDRIHAIHGSRVDEPQTRAESGEIGTRLARALAALPPAQRDAFLLQQEAGLSLAEIGALTGAGEETVKSRLRYATAKLRESLGDLR